MLTARNVLPAALSVMLVTALTACGSSAAKESASEKADKDPDQLVFVAIPDEESTTLQQRFKPLIDLLEKETEKKVVIQAATDYAAVIEGQRARKVDIAQHGPLSYVVARASGVKLTPIGAQVTKRGEDPGYQSYGIVKKDSAIKNLEEFAGQKVCFADPNSTSGYLYPKAALRKVGIDNTKDITEVMAGGQDASVLSVDKGQCDAGFAAEAMVDTLLPGKGSIKKGDLRVVWKSDMIPGSPVTVSDDLSPALRKKITDAFVEKANEDYLRAHGFCTGDACRIGENWGYVPVADADFDSVRDVCRVTRDKQCKNPE